MPCFYLIGIRYSSSQQVNLLFCVFSGKKLENFSSTKSRQNVSQSELAHSQEVTTIKESLVEEFVPHLDEETLKLLGDDPSKDESEQFHLHQDLVQRWKGWISSGLKKDTLEELLKKYGRSGNCPLDAPKMNPEIEAALSETTVKRDKHFMQSQKLLDQRW